MEKLSITKINKLIDQNHKKVIKDIRQRLKQLNLQNNPVSNELLKILQENLKFKIAKDAVHRQQRKQNTIPDTDRCIGLKLNGSQCTRQRRENSKFCKTHSSAPNGELDQSQNKLIKSSVTATDVNGIIYFIDDNNLVFLTEDVMIGKTDPRCIGRYVKSKNKVIYNSDFKN